MTVSQSEIMGALSRGKDVTRLSNFITMDDVICLNIHAMRQSFFFEVLESLHFSYQSRIRSESEVFHLEILQDVKSFGGSKSGQLHIYRVIFMVMFLFPDHGSIFEVEDRSGQCRALHFVVGEAESRAHGNLLPS